MEYKNPTPVAVTIVRVRNSSTSVGILGITRGIAPFIGEDALPSGYLEEMENFEMAAARELKEETGVDTKPEDWKLISSVPTPRNIVLVFCELQFELDAATVMKNFVPNEEVTSLIVLDWESKLCFPLHQEALAKAFSGK